MQGSGNIYSPLMDYFTSKGFESGKNGSSYLNRFTTPEEEIAVLYNGVGLIDLSSEGIFELKGKDVLEFLHRISTNVVKDIPKEGIVNTIFTNEKGRMIDTASLLNFEDFQLLFTSADNKDKVYSWINKYIIMDDVKIAFIPGKYVLFQLLGPQADSFISFTCGNIVNNIKPGTFKIINNEGIIFFLAKFTDSRGNLSYWVLADVKNGQALVESLNENRGPYDFGFIGTEAQNSYRIEQGLPAAPFEINDNYNPHEARLLDMVSFTKGCYIGQEVIARLDTYNKVQKFLTGVVLSAPVGQNENFVLLDEEGNEVGNITSTAYSYKCKKYIGLAYIRRAFNDAGTVLTAKNNRMTIKAEVHNLPFKK